MDPKADLTFKKVFGEHQDLVISFLNALLPFESEEEKIVSVEYLRNSSALILCVETVCYAYHAEICPVVGI